MPKNIVCFSHLRWDFVYQRPQHLLSRFALAHRVWFIEEPVYEPGAEDHFKIFIRDHGVQVAVPHLQDRADEQQNDTALRLLLKKLLDSLDMEECLFWYYSPMALKLSSSYKPKMIIYDCMDELSAFRFAPAEMISQENALLKVADLVFTGGFSLYQAKKDKHDHIFPFPSSIDKAHFQQARTPLEIPADQLEIPEGPKIGFYGVIDERFDLELIDEIAAFRPDWQLVLIGPVVKIDSSTLPKRDNIHYLGSKSYQELPQYLAGWDMAMIPFLLNASTAFISPTKTPEYLAAGIPVVSTPINDVIRPYGSRQLVHIAADSAAFIRAIETELNREDHTQRLEKTDRFLATISWDITFREMIGKISNTLQQNNLLITANV